MVNSGKQINDDFLLRWSSKTFRCWVNEILVDWAPPGMTSPFSPARISTPNDTVYQSPGTKGNYSDLGSVGIHISPEAGFPGGQIFPTTVTDSQQRL